MPADFNRISLAQKLRERGVPKGDEYTRAWSSFNQFYNAESDGSERSRAMNSILNHMSESQAQNLLVRLTDSIAFFTRLPPADMRRNKADEGYRLKGKQDLDIVNDSHKASLERIAHLVSVLYQVRCNLVHGEKDPDSKRDHEVVSWSLDALNKILPVLF